MTSYILDASVAAKWFLPAEGEPLTGEAAALRDRFSAGDCRLAVPDLFWAEVGNVLCKAARSGRMKPPFCHAAMGRLAELGIQTLPTRHFAKRALPIALDYDRSAYDATYVALAVESNAPLVTADERLVNALSGRFPVRWLGGLYW